MATGTQGTGTFFAGSSTRVAGSDGTFDWRLPVAASVGADPTFLLYSDPGYGTVAAGPSVMTATADPTLWTAPFAGSLPPGAYWVEAQVLWYGASAVGPGSPVPYRGHVLILSDPTADTLTPPSWAPTLDDLAALVPHRTIDDSGIKQYHFSEMTRPPDWVAQMHLDAAVAQELASFGDVGSRLGAKIKRAATYLAAATLEEALKPSSDLAANSADDPAIQQWYAWYEKIHAEILSARNSGVIGSPRQPGAIGQYSPNYGPHSRWRGWGGW